LRTTTVSEGASAPLVIVEHVARVTEPLTTQSVFETNAKGEACHPLPFFGKKLFDTVPDTSAPLNDVPVPADYVLGAGDQLQIWVLGKVDLGTRVEIDRNGQIFLPKGGALRVAGTRYDQLEGFPRPTIGDLYNKFERNVTIKMKGPTNFLQQLRFNTKILLQTALTGAIVVQLTSRMNYNA
jgi:hypothetical protein